MANVDVLNRIDSIYQKHIEANVAFIDEFSEQENFSPNTSLKLDALDECLNYALQIKDSAPLENISKKFI